MAQAKGHRDGMVLSSENRRRPMSSGEVEGVSWQGLRTIFLKKNSQGFGFTLRHFIVYPPESSLHSLKDEENGNALGKGSQQSCLEPMDTIFVKSVKEHGPAQQAGLCSGDRLVKVNGKIILGKTYSQVIALIQNSENILELTIMPKDEDVLQLVYSQDAYLKGNEPYLGEAQNLPDPPSLCYHSTKPSSTARLASQSIQSPLDTGQCRPDPPLVDDRLPAASNPTSEDSSGHFAPAGWHRGRSCSAINALDFHFSNHNAAIVCATLPPPRKSRLPASVNSHADALCHQALSHWYYSQTEAAERMPSRHLSTSQDHLVELGLGLALGPKPTFSMSTASAEQHRKEILLNQQATASNDCYWMGVLSGISGTGRRSCSESLLAAYAEYEHNYGRSVEMLAQASALVSPRYEQTSQSPQVTKMSKQKDQKSSGGQQHKSITSPITTSSSQSTIMDTTNSISGQQVAEPQTRRIKEDEPVGYKSYSPSFSHKAIHLVHQAHSIREPSYSGPNPSSWSSTTDIEGGVVPRLQSTLAFSGLEEERSQLDESREVISPNQEVVLRQQPPSNRRKPTQALQHPNYTTPVESTEPSVLTPSPGNASLVSSRTGPNSRTNGSLAEHAYDSLSSIPFIGSIKSRRSSYLLAITTERSKSCDEGLNTFKEENRVFSKLPKRVKSFFTDGSLESLRAQEEARSKRHSTSELGSITFSDVRKEGWLHYKQILTEKGKKVGGGMRPWKRVFSVLRCHSLFLYKDKREAVLHGAGAGASQDEHPPVSIRGCLIDIAYSETKRKHTLRLTTQDFCEYLLQAEDRDDMLAWIRAIRENSKTDNEEISFSKQALINKKLNDYRKHSLTGNKTDSSPRTHRMMPTFLLSKTDSTSLNRTDENKALWGINIMKKTRKPETPKAFGVRLEDCQPAVNHKFVPLIVEMCCGVVETTGLEYTGIYRVPGNNAMVSNLQEHLNKGMDIHTAEERWQDLNVICSLLKSFFRKLPEPLFTDDKYNDFIDANRIEDAEDRLKTMKKLIQDLPDHYYHTLKFLVAHLKKVADHSVKNKMEPRNLALVFGPTLVRTSADNMTDMVTHMPDRYKIVETLILHCDWFFSDGELDEEEKAPEDKQNMQPAPNIDHLLSNIGRPGMPDSTTSNSLKSKNSLGSKKDHNTKDFLPTSMISTVTRKRKKCLSTHLPGSSTDEESDREPVEASIYREGEGGENDRGQEEEAEGEHTISKKDKKGNGVKARETTEVTDSQVGGEKAEKEGRGGISNGIIKFPRESRQRITSPGNVSQLHPNSFFYSHHQSHATNIRLPPTTNSTSTLGPQKLARGHPMVPLWVSPTRLHSHYQSSSFYQTKQLDWNQPVPVIYRKTRGGRIRAISMNPELELGWNEDIVKRWSAQKVEVVKVIEERPGQIGSVGVLQGSVVDSRSIQQIDSLPCLAQDAPTLASSTSGWKRQCST